MRQWIILCGLLLLHSAHSKAQSFTVAHDTVNISTSSSSSATFTDSIINLTGSAIGVQWKVIATNFPPDWRGACSAFCDPALCYTLADLWPATSTRSFTANPGGHTFYLTMDFSCATSTGCYYITVSMANPSVPADDTTETFIICRAPLGSVDLKPAANSVSIYPNPAAGQLNVVYDLPAAVSRIAIYDLLGTLISTLQPASQHTAQLNIVGLPSGSYFLKLQSEHGETIATQKFSKQ